MKVRGIPLPLSQSCRDINPTLTKTVDAMFDEMKDKKRARTRVGLRCGMNKTESEFALILEAQKREGKIIRYLFEGITLRFANVKYTPDFVVMRDVNMTPDADNWLVFIEVKGPFVKGNRERAVERFRHAKTYWPEFSFEMMQRQKDGRWVQII